jgi:hypothetical protein
MILRPVKPKKRLQRSKKKRKSYLRREDFNRH